MDHVERFCECIRARSSEHSEAMNRVGDLPGIMFSILRQELDSMVRVIFLLAIDNMEERRRLIAQTVNGENWTVISGKGKIRKVTDREMVELANKLQGWTLSVYKFGCAFIHLSNFHDHSTSNPFDALDVVEQTDILEHLRYYHGGPIIDHPSFAELSSYSGRVFEKIASNLECYLKEIESGDVEHV